MSRWLRPGLMGGVFGTYIPSGGGGGGGSGPTLPTLTTSGLVLRQRLHANTPTGQLYKDNALTQQAAAGDTILGIKDISGAGNNFADIQPGQGMLLTSNIINGKAALTTPSGLDGIVETRASSYLSTLGGAQHVTLFFICYIYGVPQASYVCSASRRFDAVGVDPDSLVIRIGGAGAYITAGRLGAQGRNANGGFPLLTYSTDINAAWGDFTQKGVKIVLRACTGTSQTQRLDIAGSDGTHAGTHSTGYTNVAADTDGGSGAWNFFAIADTYYSGNPTGFPVVIEILEVDVWTGTTQMSDADVASLMSYGTTQAGF